MLKLQVIGNLGKDAEVRTVNGKTVIGFSVAHTEKYTSNGQQQQKTTWVNCSYWTDKTAIAPYLKKGTSVYVEGSPDVRVWGDAGNQKASMELRVLSVQLLGGGQQQPASNVTQGAVTDFDNDAPF